MIFYPPLTFIEVAASCDVDNFSIQGKWTPFLVASEVSPVEAIPAILHHLGSLAPAKTHHQAVLKDPAEES